MVCREHAKKPTENCPTVKIGKVPFIGHDAKIDQSHLGDLLEKVNTQLKYINFTKTSSCKYDEDCSKAKELSMRIPVLFILFSALFSALQGDIQKTAQFSTLLEH